MEKRALQDFLEDLCFGAGRLTLKARESLSGLKINAKRDKDYVTETDVAAEEYITSRIKAEFPEHSILGEEMGLTEGSGERWIIDPIDGTNSFMHGLPFYCISVAFERDGEVQLGGVYAPVLDEFFIGIKGAGAFLNDKKISVSSTKDIGMSMAVTGFACLREGKTEYGLRLFNNVVPNVRDIRRHGSAAIDTCYLAAGRFDLYWENFLNIYDLAAAKLILEEAGGILTDFSGTGENLYSEVAASNNRLHSKVLELLNK
ncbi:inositol monophosphatase family protein [Sedimentisphaera salicampi]|uniref:inositol monophosphatase family protein n=1 Tax=Sedimentisphaera salicampi TaxID=1941349 RepID=UPI000B9AE92D|nr:inositol monophosphatase family protein [Sedimentisphaera salicampi]